MSKEVRQELGHYQAFGGASLVGCWLGFGCLRGILAACVSWSQYHHALAGGSFDCRLPILDCRLILSSEANRHSAIDNLQSKDPPATAWWYWLHDTRATHQNHTWRTPNHTYGTLPRSWTVVYVELWTAFPC